MRRPATFHTVRSRAGALRTDRVKPNEWRRDRTRLIKEKKIHINQHKKKPQQQRDRRLPKRVGPFFSIRFPTHFHS